VTSVNIDAELSAVAIRISVMDRRVNARLTSAARLGREQDADDIVEGRSFEPLSHLGNALADILLGRSRSLLPGVHPTIPQVDKSGYP
jgi:hypothetical protein